MIRKMKRYSNKRKQKSGDGKRVAVVTGSGRGIGLEVVHQLAELGFKVVLTSPNRIEGEAASAKLLREGLDVNFHILDVVNEKHIRALPWTGHPWS